MRCTGREGTGKQQGSRTNPRKTQQGSKGQVVKETSQGHTTAWSFQEKKTFYLCCTWETKGRKCLIARKDNSVKHFWDVVIPGDLQTTQEGLEEQMEREEAVSSQDASRRLWRKKSKIRNWGHRVEGTLKHGLRGCVSSTPGGRAGREGSASKKMNVLPLHARQHNHTQCQVSPDTRKMGKSLCTHCSGSGPKGKKNFKS